MECPGLRPSPEFCSLVPLLLLDEISQPSVLKYNTCPHPAQILSLALAFLMSCLSANSQHCRQPRLMDKSLCLPGQICFPRLNHLSKWHHCSANGSDSQLLHAPDSAIRKPFSCMLNIPTWSPSSHKQLGSSDHCRRPSPLPIVPSRPPQTSLLVYVTTLQGFLLKIKIQTLYRGPQNP